MSHKLEYRYYLTTTQCYSNSQCLWWCVLSQTAPPLIRDRDSAARDETAPVSLKPVHIKSLNKWNLIVRLAAHRALHSTPDLSHSRHGSPSHTLLQTIICWWVILHLQWNKNFWIGQNHIIKKGLTKWSSVYFPPGWLSVRPGLMWTLSILAQAHSDIFHLQCTIQMPGLLATFKAKI